MERASHVFTFYLTCFRIFVGDCLYSGSLDGRICQWDVLNGSWKCTWDVDKRIDCMEIVGDVALVGGPCIQSNACENCGNGDGCILKVMLV